MDKPGASEGLSCFHVFQDEKEKRVDAVPCQQFGLLEV